MRVRNKWLMLIMSIDYAGTSGNPVKVAELGAGEKMAPFFHCKLAYQPFGIICITDYDEFAIARDLDALTVVAGTRDTPVKIPCS